MFDSWVYPAGVEIVVLVLRSLILLGVFVALIASTTAILHASQTITINFPRFLSVFSEKFPDRVKVAEEWQVLTQQHQNTSELERLQFINEFVHQQLTYRTDSSLYNQEDYWASPLETLGLGQGDCEDWAIMVYVTLRQLGVDDKKLRLIYVRAKLGGVGSTISQAHMVVGYYPSLHSEPLIIDSLIQDVLPASQRPDLKPVFSFNSAGIWGGQMSNRPLATSTARLSRWRNLIDRLSKEGVILDGS